jgi:hypothetical protein
LFEPFVNRRQLHLLFSNPVILSEAKNLQSVSTPTNPSVSDNGANPTKRAKGAVASDGQTVESFI